MRTLRGLLSVVLVGLLPATAAVAEQPYWICVDAQFNKSVQDQPCAYAPEAPPSGPVTVAPGAVEEPLAAVDKKPSAKPRTSELDAMAWWQQQYGRGVKAIEQRGGVEGLLRNPWLYFGLGAIALLWVLRWAWVSGLPRLRARRLEREASAQPDAYRSALLSQSLQAAAKPAESAARLLEQQPAQPTRWTPELLRTLGPEQFTQLCLRLWQTRGLRAEREPGSVGDTVILLRHPARSEGLHGVVLSIQRRDGALGPSVVRELIGLMSEHACDYGALMTPGEFSTEARNAVRGRSIELKGWMTLMTELEALPDDARAALLGEVLAQARSTAGPAQEMLRP